MRLQRYEVPVRPQLPRRSLLKGGFGLVTGAMLGGLSDDYATYVVPRREEPPAPPEPEPPAPQPEPPAPEPEPPAQLSRGSAGQQVWGLQERLNATGFWCGTPDGGFGHLTEQAVYAVQKTHGLVRDGIAGAATLAAVDSGLRPLPVAGGDHVEVHLGRQLILVVRGGATQLVLNTSTGNGEPYEYEERDYLAHTPTGDFAVWFMDGGGWRDGELGEMYRPMFYSGNYAIHGSDSIPPWPASHGCARVSVAAMDMIWAQGLLGMGGRVLVV
ncbi:L,D-transpeptidase family protein [Ornithinimicrobium sufpigmenti]|uniref:L,D-transpeptidase family protein n=1 Tax=Ornithinimicrobium sufpigmenti TaxID=2508882 RepID=UPI001EDCC248|nr:MULTISPECIES: L,D-transpeptidase family protein [unclassified Ornithinimicrobium]